MESKASEKAVAAGREWNPSPYPEDHRKAIDAAHDPALGLDRSVCLRDVVEALRSQFGVTNRAADWLQREFGRGS